MSEDDASLNARPASGAEGVLRPGEVLLRAFNDSRDELISTLAFLLGNSEDAQDVAQDVFLRCWRMQDNLGDVQNLRAWIFRVGLNAAKDLQRSAWRRRTRRFSGRESFIQDQCTPAQTAEEQEVKERLRQALLQLRPEEKEVFLLRQNADLTFDQIAALHGRPVGTVKTQMRSALQKLRKVLGDEAKGPE